ncbi:MAG: hypothetical protein VKO39_12240 [Cyanobacteriota bacterium]|nr:hypothetical protein [Cyanobacteriota bacterium]
MINLQIGGQGDGGLGASTLKRLWLWTPIVAGGALSLFLLLALALPQGLEVNRMLQRIKELEQYRQDVDLLTLQAQSIQKNRQLARRQAEQLIRLVTGKGDLSTFLATLDLEARQSGVSMELYEPVASGEGAPGARPRQGGAPPPPPAPPPPGGGGAGAAGKAPSADVLGKAGLKERSLVMVASGTYPQLLDFLRRMELLEVLVEQKELTLTVPDSTPGRASELPPRVPTVEVRLTLTLWSKAPKEDRNNGAATPPPPGAPAAPAPPAAPG